MNYKEYKRQEILKKFEPIAIARRKEQRKLKAQALVLFWSRIKAPSINSCWYMVYNKDKTRTVNDQRKIYRHFRGDIPDGFELHHTCKNGWCVNPRHIKLCTFEEHLAEHGKLKHVRFKSSSKYQTMVRKLLESRVTLFSDQ